MITSVKKAEMRVHTTLGEVYQATETIDKSPETPVTLIIDEIESGAVKIAHRGTGAKLKEHLKNRKFLLRGKSEEANALGKDFRENITF